jgi:mRNA interferase MazF
VSKRTYFPDRGDLIEINFQPSAGREIDERRPAIVISPLTYNRKSGLCLAVPISSDLTPGPFWIPLPPGLLPRASLVLCDYVKSCDYRERSATFRGRVPDDFVDEIVSDIFDLIDPTT